MSEILELHANINFLSLNITSSQKNLYMYYVYLFVSYIWPNGWTKLADIFFKGTHGYLGGSIG